MRRFAVPAVALVIGAGLLVAYVFRLFGDWGTFVVGALLFSGGAFGMIDAFEDHHE